MNKNEIYIKSGTNYKEMTKELLAQCGLASVISDKKMQIGIKPNLVSPSEASWGATTHPEIVAGIIEYLQENGYGNIAILEGSWGGKYRFSDQCSGIERPLSDKDHMCIEKYERIDPQYREASFSCDGTA